MLYEFACFSPRTCLIIVMNERNNMLEL